MNWVIGKHSWNVRVFDEVISKYTGTWRFVSDPAEINLEELAKDSPEYLFFMHWSSKISDEITSKYKCVVFHPSDLPFGRGGTPIQNLIGLGIRETKISAFRMISKLDAGPVYMKWTISLEGSSAEEIYIRISEEIAKMIQCILNSDIEPEEQEGEITIFKRRTSAMSAVPQYGNLQEMFDFIRMLDAESYPKAFIDWGEYRLEFSRATLYDGRVEASVKITEIK